MRDAQGKTRELYFKVNFSCIILSYRQVGMLVLNETQEAALTGGFKRCWSCTRFSFCRQVEFPLIMNTSKNFKVIVRATKSSILDFAAFDDKNFDQAVSGGCQNLLFGQQQFMSFHQLLVVSHSYCYNQSLNELLAPCTAKAFILNNRERGLSHCTKKREGGLVRKQKCRIYYEHRQRRLSRTYERRETSFFVKKN